MPLWMNKFDLSSEKKSQRVHKFGAKSKYLGEYMLLTLEKEILFNSQNGPTLKKVPFWTRNKIWIQVRWFFTDILYHGIWLIASSTVLFYILLKEKNNILIMRREYRPIDQIQLDGIWTIGWIDFWEQEQINRICLMCRKNKWPSLINYEHVSVQLH